MQHVFTSRSPSDILWCHPVLSGAVQQDDLQNYSNNGKADNKSFQKDPEVLVGWSYVEFDDFISYIINIWNMSHPWRILVFPPFPSLPFLARWRLFGSSPEVLVAVARDAKDGGRGGHVVVVTRVGKLEQYKGRLSHYLQGSIHPRWCRISSINTILRISYPFRFFTVRGLECRFEKTSASQCCHFKTGQF